MGRRKKETTFSYTEIVISTYVRKGEYERAQLNYSNDLGRIGAPVMTSRELTELEPDVEESEESD